MPKFPSSNLVQNGGFETPYPDDFLQPDQWTDFQTSSRTAYRDRRTFHSGAASLKLLTDPAAGTQQVYQRLPGVEAGDVLRVSFWAKTNGQVYGQVILLSGTLGEAPQLLAEKSFREESWQPYTFTVTVPAGLTAPLAIHLGHADGKVAGGVVWFDDVTVVKTGRVSHPPRRVSKELTRNGGFEEMQSRDGHGAQPVEWTVRNLTPKEEKPITFEVAAPGRSGARCVKIAGASGDSFVALSQEVKDVNPGGWYVLRLAYRTEGDVKGGAMIIGLDEKGNDVQISIAGDFVPCREWRTMEHNFQLSPDAKSAQIVINVVGTSAVYVDDVSLVAGKLPAPLIARQPRWYPLSPIADAKTRTLQGHFWQGQFHNGLPENLTFREVGNGRRAVPLVQRVAFGLESAGKVTAPTTGETGFDVVKSYYKRYRANLKFASVHNLQVFTESINDSPFLYISPRLTLGREASDQTLLTRFTLSGSLDTVTWFSDGVMRTQTVSAFGGRAVHVSRERPVMLFYNRESQEGVLIHFPLPAPELRQWFVEDYRVKAMPTLMATMAGTPPQTDVTFRIGPFNGEAGDTLDFYFALMGFEGKASDALRAVQANSVWEQRTIGVGGESIAMEQLGITQGDKSVKQRAGTLPPRTVYRMDFKLDNTEKTQCIIAAYLMHDRRVDARPALRIAVNGQPLTDKTPPLNADAIYKVADKESPLYDAQKAAWTLRRERSINGQLDEQHPLYSPELAKMNHRLIFDISSLVKKGENFVTVENVGDEPLILPAIPSHWRYFPVEGYSGRVDVQYPNLHEDGFAWGLPRWSCDNVMATLQRFADLTGKTFWRDAALRHFIYYLEKSNEQGLVPERITRRDSKLETQNPKPEIYFVPGSGHNDLWFALHFLPSLPANEREADYRLLQRLRTLYDPQNPNGWVTPRADGSFWFEPRQFANEKGEPPYIVASHCAALRVSATMMQLSKSLGQEEDAKFWQNVTQRGIDALVWYLSQEKAWDVDDSDGDALALTINSPEPRASGNAHLECLRHLVQVMSLTDYRRSDQLPHVRKMAQHVVKNNADAHGEEDLDFATTLYPFAARFAPALFKAIDEAYRAGLERARILNWLGAGVPDAQPALPITLESSPDLPLPCMAAWNVVVLENLMAQDQTVTIKVAEGVKVESAQELVANDKLTVEGQTIRCVVPAGRIRAVRINVEGKEGEGGGRRGKEGEGRGVSNNYPLISPSFLLFPPPSPSFPYELR